MIRVKDVDGKWYIQTGEFRYELFQQNPDDPYRWVNAHGPYDTADEANTAFVGVKAEWDRETELLKRGEATEDKSDRQHEKP